MFNTAAKLQFGFAAVALVSALVYGVVTGDPAIFILNMGVFVAFTLGGLAMAGSGTGRPVTCQLTTLRPSKW
jgi:hypothetical protein